MAKKDGEKAADQYNARVGRPARLRSIAEHWEQQGGGAFYGLAMLAREMADFMDGK